MQQYKSPPCCKPKKYLLEVQSLIEPHNNQGWDFTLCFFMLIARLLTKKSEPLFCFFALLEKMTRAIPPIRSHRFLKRKLLLPPFFKRVGEWWRAIISFFYKSKAKKCDINFFTLYEQFAHFRRKLDIKFILSSFLFKRANRSYALKSEKSNLLILLFKQEWCGMNRSLNKEQQEQKSKRVNTQPC